MSKITSLGDSEWGLFAEYLNRPAERLEDGWDFKPDWRWRKLLQYVRVVRRAPGNTEPAVSIHDETDQLLIDAYIDVVHGTKSNRSIQWAMRAVKYNYETGCASRAKAMILAGASMTAIGHELRASRQDVETFSKLHFDVIPYLDCPSWVATLFAPFQTLSSAEEALPAMAAEAKERMWMMIGSQLGLEPLRLIINRTMAVSPKDLTSLKEAMESMMFMAGFDYAATMRTFGNSRPADFEKAMQFLAINTQNKMLDKDKGGQNMGNFFTDLFGTGLDNIKLMAPTKGTAMLQALASKDPQKLTKYFGPEEKQLRLSSKVVDFLAEPEPVLKSARTFSI